MILTGKCKEKFLEWIALNDYQGSLWALNNNQINSIILNALIIEFFDSIEYNKNSSLWDYCFFDCYWNKGLREYKQPTIQAIKKANNLHNERFK